MKKLLLASLLLASLTGCRSWVSLAENKITINAPTRIDRKGEFYFTLNATDKYGDPDAVVYQWAVAWVGVEGSVHKGKSGVTEKIRVKGGTGKALLKILGWDTHEKWTEIASHAFDVE